MRPLNIFKENGLLYSALILSIAILISSWFSVRQEQIAWFNISPPPTQEQSNLLGLGDSQLSYRLLSLLLQNAGEIAGESKALSEYNYQQVVSWLELLNKLDPQSNFSPFLASFYFSNAKDPEKLRLLVRYLEEVGEQPEPHKWRWLGQAISIARFDLKDTELALRLAQKLAALDRPNMAAWTKQLPAFILQNKGDKKEAYKIMLNILQSHADTMPPEEIYFMRDYICTRLLSKQEAQIHELCTYQRQGE